MVRFPVLLDKLEAGLIPRRKVRKLTWLVFPPAQMPATETITARAAFHQALLLCSMMVAYLIAIFLILPLLVTLILLVYFQHDLQHFSERVIWQIFRLAYWGGVKHFWQEGTPAEYISTLAGVDGFLFAWAFAKRWAWNRRAERLKREGTGTLPVEAAARGVWPPPPREPS